MALGLTIKPGILMIFDSGGMLRVRESTYILWYELVLTQFDPLTHLIWPVGELPWKLDIENITPLKPTGMGDYMAVLPFEERSLKSQQEI